MKKMMMYLSMVVLAFMLTGCSVDLDFSASKSDQFTETAETLGDQFTETKNKMERLEQKESLTSNDQKLIVNEINELSKVMNEFETEDAPFLVKQAKKIAVKKLKERKKVIMTIQKKAKKGSANHEDVKEIINALSDDIEINLFKK
ncbi:hypothetical protein ACFSO7_15380 [Bacillus sp. CGMCC 1.16607]|uniref:hypothetical protein n=1 Tax=Bacillus sp. CGMCC 1.16607 TaxID=3351842 RepID=UPI00362FA37E